MIARFRAAYPGYDVYAVKADYDYWLAEDGSRVPKNYEAAFLGFAKRHITRNR